MIGDGPKKQCRTRVRHCPAADWIGSELVGEAGHAGPKRMREVGAIGSASVGAERRAVDARCRRVAKIGVTDLGAPNPVAEHVLEAETGGPAHPCRVLIPACANSADERRRNIDAVEDGDVVPDVAIGHTAGEVEERRFEIQSSPGGGAGPGAPAPPVGWFCVGPAKRARPPGLGGLAPTPVEVVFEPHTQAAFLPVVPSVPANNPACLADVTGGKTEETVEVVPV